MRAFFKVIRWLTTGAFMCGAVVLIAAYRVDPHREYEHHSRFYRALLNGCIMVFTAVHRIHIHISGEEIIPEDGRFVLISNRISKYDPLIISYKLKSCDLAFFVESDCFRVPVIGRLMRRCCFYACDQKNHQKYLQSLLAASAQIQEREIAVGLFRETEVSKKKTIEKLAESLVVAQTANVPVVFISLDGMEKELKLRNPSRKDVYLYVIDTIPAEQIAGDDLMVLAEKILNKIQKVDVLCEGGK